MNLQLAYYMGFTEAILIGMDFSYTVPASSQVEGNHITSMGDDPNHFHPDYYGKGKVWKDPKLERVLANYALAKQMYEADGRRILNATPGGELGILERLDHTSMFQPYVLANSQRPRRCVRVRVIDSEPRARAIRSRGVLANSRRSDNAAAFRVSMSAASSRICVPSSLIVAWSSTMS